MQIRPAHIDDAAAIARVHVTSWQRTYRGIVPDSYLESLSVEDRARRWGQILSDPDASTVAFVADDDSEGVVGFASGGPERSSDPVYTGELYAIYIDAAQHSQGIGRQLVRAVAERLLARGHHTILVWVLADNPARHFYAALGGEQKRTQQIEIGGAKLEEVAYVWDDIGVLVG